MKPDFGPEVAAELATMMLASLHRLYPNKIAHVLYDDGDVGSPKQLTPIFYGSFDWHSSVHTHASLLRLLRLRRAARDRAPWMSEARAALAESFVAANAAQEEAYLRARPGFEMPYGIVWLLALGGELRADPDWAHVYQFMAPLIEYARARFMSWLVDIPGPIRSGQHSQSAFAMGLVFDCAQVTGDGELMDLVRQRARDFYGDDVAAPTTYEPSAYDFLSPSLAEADLMRRIMPPEEFAAWLPRFLPQYDDFAPVLCRDRTDGKLVHFDGLNLSRAWMLRNLGQPALAASHAEAGLAGLRGAHYAGSHWLGTFALCWYAGPIFGDESEA